VSFLYAIMKRPNFTLRSQPQVTQLVLEGNHVVGVEYLQDGRIVRAGAQQEFIVCDGAYESPKLLMLSGIGPAETLKTHSIPVIVDLPGVGQNLQDHLILGVAYLSKHEHPFMPTLLAETGFFMRTRSGIRRLHQTSRWNSEG
jgi:choline dehydrogenase-like flavoprotein